MQLYLPRQKKNLQDNLFNEKPKLSKILWNIIIEL